MYSPPLTSFLMPSTDDDFISCDLLMLTGDSFDIDEALRTIPLPAATAALSRIEDNVFENLTKIII